MVKKPQRVQKRNIRIESVGYCKKAIKANRKRCPSNKNIAREIQNLTNNTGPRLK
jgi:hypothetical protein